MSPLLAAYRAAVSLLGPFAGLWLQARARQGKEDSARLGERFGRYSAARPEGRVVWLHGASVGESGVALQLIDALAARDPQLSFLLSTGTRSSAALAARRVGAHTIHVYAPLDRADAVSRFLSHWRPDLGVFVESEIWPNLILAARARGVKLALVNARMSPKTLHRWRAWRAAGARLIGAFDYLSAADARTAAALSDLSGKPTPMPGNLKLAAPALHVDAEARCALAAAAAGRPLWLAASTHAGEDEIAFAAHAALRRVLPEALLIVAPRHPERGEAVAALAGGAPRRSRGEPIGAAPIYVADTLGEMGVLFDLAPVAFLAGSLLPHLKGHNPVEPARLNAAIVAGPFVESFEDVFAALSAAGGVTLVRDAASLADAVGGLLADAGARARQIEAAAKALSHGAGALDANAEALLQLAPQHSAQARATIASA